MKIHDDAMYREGLIRNAFEYVAKNNWGVKQLQYLNLVERLTGKKAFAEKETQVL
jgi:hypothetical protein